jgi:hypothetical protein
MRDFTIFIVHKILLGSWNEWKRGGITRSTYKWD